MNRRRERGRTKRRKERNAEVHRNDRRTFRVHTCAVNKKSVSSDKKIHIEGEGDTAWVKIDAFVHLVTLRILQIYGTIYQSDLAIVVSWSES